MVFGIAGAGKSAILNTLKDGNPESQSFKSEFGSRAVTTKIQKENFKIYGVHNDKEYTFYDVPGLLDSKFRFDKWSEDFLRELKDQKIDLVLLVFNGSDFRL